MGFPSGGNKSQGVEAMPPSQAAATQRPIICPLFLRGAGGGRDKTGTGIPKLLNIRIPIPSTWSDI